VKLCPEIRMVGNSNKRKYADYIMGAIGTLDVLLVKAKIYQL